MRNSPKASTAIERLRIGSLFSGYGGLDLAVEHVFGGSTVWFSEINKPVACVFEHHWPDVSNLGDITTIDWSTVPPVDILCGGFPCQDVSTVGKMAGIAPGTRSGLWANMAESIDQLKPRYVIAENVRGLLSAQAIRPHSQGAPDAIRNSETATLRTATPIRSLEPGDWSVGDRAARPLRALGAVLGDLADLGYDAQWIGLPASAIGAPHPRFRIFIIAHRTTPDSTRDRCFTGRRTLEPGEGSPGNGRTVASGDRFSVERAARLERMAARTRDTVAPDRRHLQRWGRYADAVARWEYITGHVSPGPAHIREHHGPRAAPEFVEWLMGLEPGWVTSPIHGLTASQQLTALGNGVLPLQALGALRQVVQ